MTQFSFISTVELLTAALVYIFNALMRVVLTKEGSKENKFTFILRLT